MNQSWQRQLEAFFDLRGKSVVSDPTLEDLCYVSGRDPRIWREPGTLDDLRQSLVDQLNIDARSTLLEVGAGSGFAARLLAPEVHEYVGIDLAEGALEVAKKLDLSNASFMVSDGADIPFPNDHFDAAFCYDVFTNFPTFEEGKPLIREMIRVVKPGGRVLIGSIPDEKHHSAYMKKAEELGHYLDGKYGPVDQRAELSKVPYQRSDAPKAGVSGFLKSFFGFANTNADVNDESGMITPQIVTYEFVRNDFEDFGKTEGVHAEITPIHSKHPYTMFRFNAVFHVVES